MNPSDTMSAERLQTTEMVLQMDPFRRKISGPERSKIVVEAFATAGKRIEVCAIPTRRTLPRASPRPRT